MLCMSPINRHLARVGICNLEPLYSPDEIAALNRAVDPLFAAQADRPRAYVYSDDIVKQGLLPMVLSQRVRGCLFDIMPDAALYHMHIYEIAANQTQPHIFHDVMAGWHVDPDVENRKRESTHISLFIYLTDVGEGDGAFEFIPQHPFSWLHKNTPYCSMMGPKGTCFAWNRSYYHRASSNRGPVRRRLLKISIQSNRFSNQSFEEEHFRELVANVPSGDVATDLLMGRYLGQQAPLQQGVPTAFTPVVPNRTLALSNKFLAMWQVRLVVRAIKRCFKPVPQKAALYD